MSYKLLDHTADIGISVKAETLEGLFMDAARAMFEIIGHSARGVDQKIEISLKTDTIEDLLHDFLSELLYIYETDDISFSRFKIQNFRKTHLCAIAYGEIVQPEDASVEIKAVTYHKLKIEKDKKGYKVNVIFDI